MTVLTGSAKKEKKHTFLREVQNELKKVNWTSKDELKICTKVVVGSTFTFGLGIYLIDLVIQGTLNSIGHIARLIGG